MDYFAVEPEVAGGLGEGTLMDSRVHPPVVSRLEYQFFGWLGDVLLESFPCFVVTKEAELRLRDSGLTGAVYDKVAITTSDEFDELFPDTTLPEFTWLKPVGVRGTDDFTTAEDGRLVVSSRALDVLKSLGIANALVEPI